MGGPIYVHAHSTLIQTKVRRPQRVSQRSNVKCPPAPLLSPESAPLQLDVDGDGRVTLLELGDWMEAAQMSEGQKREILARAGHHQHRALDFHRFPTFVRTSPSQPLPTPTLCRLV